MKFPHISQTMELRQCHSLAGYEFPNCIGSATSFAFAFYKIQGLYIGEERGEMSLTNHNLRGSARDHHLRCRGRPSSTLQDDHYMHVNLIKTALYAAGSMSLLPQRCHCRTPRTQQGPVEHYAQAVTRPLHGATRRDLVLHLSQ